MLFAVVYLPSFLLQASLRHEPELFLQPAALVEGDATKGTLQQVTDAARVAGVVEGLSCAQAMARCAGLIFKTRSAAAEKAATDVFLQTAAAFSPFIENTDPGICTIDLKGLGFEAPGSSQSDDDGVELRSGVQQSFGFLDSVPRQAGKNVAPKSPVQLWAETLLTALESVHLHARIGIARTPAFALLATRCAQPVDPKGSPHGEVVMVENERAFVADLPLESLEPEPRTLDVLRRWGIHHVAQFIALGKDAIAERLGPEALELFDRVSPDRVRPLDIVPVPASFDEEMEFEVHVETLEPLLFVLRRFVEQLATRIGLTYRVVAQIDLRLSLESGAHYTHSFRIPAPTSHVDTLFRMLQTHLEQLRTTAPIAALRLSATPSRAENHQFGLFESALRDPNQFHETLARLVALLGNDRAGSPVVESTHRPDVFQMRRPEFEAALEAADSPRSIPAGLVLRRFRPAMHADVEVAHGKPMFVRTLFVSGVVDRSRGPWVGSGDWWDQKRWARNEWDVQLRNGTVCRLFSAQENWFLEGIYD